MSNQCARCEKTVYPMEEIRALDKVYHKGCFRCTECGNLLNLKNYKGYGKLPYCPTHYPKDKFSSVMDPTTVTALQNTKMQSTVNYHAGYERQKGTGAGGVPHHGAAGEGGAAPETAAAE